MIEIEPGLLLKDPGHFTFQLQVRNKEWKPIDEMVILSNRKNLLRSLVWRLDRKARYTMKLDDNVEYAIRVMAGKLKKARHDTVWLLGGSSGLLLQGVDLSRQPRDIDVYTDSKDAEEIYSLLNDFATDKLVSSETEIYSSRLAHFHIAGMPLELVSDFRISTAAGSYHVNVGALFPYSPEVGLGGCKVRLMPLAHELVFNVLRAREDRYEPIAARMKQAPDQYFPALERIVEDNRLTPSVVEQISRLTEV